MRRSNWPVYLLAVALVVAVATGFMYACGERQQRRDLAATNQSSTTSLSRVQNRLQSVSERMSDRMARATPPPAPERVQNRPRVRTEVERRVVRNAPRRGNIRSQLSEQLKQIVSAREEINKAKSDFSQTRDADAHFVASVKKDPVPANWRDPLCAPCLIAKGLCLQFLRTGVIDGTLST